VKIANDAIQSQIAGVRLPVPNGLSGEGFVFIAVPYWLSSALSGDRGPDSPQISYSGS